MRCRWRHLRLFTLALLALSVIGLALASSALAGAFSPESGPTQNAEDTSTLYKIVFVTGLAVIALVWGILFWCLYRYRARRGVAAVQVRGNSAIELTWTVGAVVLVTAIAIVGLIFLDDIKNPVSSGPAALAEVRGQNATINQPPVPGGDELKVKVTGRQYLWSFQYPNGAVSFHDLVVPRDRTVTLEVTTNDVAHSWWIPKMGGKVDALPQLPNETWFKATKTGEFRGQCAELCGANHAAMTARVIVIEPARYDAWVVTQKKLIDLARKAAQRDKAKFAATTEAG
jgi:cytochrome c oxidase subunit II